MKSLQGLTKLEPKLNFNFSLAYLPLKIRVWKRNYVLLPMISQTNETYFLDSPTHILFNGDRSVGIPRNESTLTFIEDGLFSTSGGEVGQRGYVVQTLYYNFFPFKESELGQWLKSRQNGYFKVTLNWSYSGIDH